MPTPTAPPRSRDFLSPEQHGRNLQEHEDAHGSGANDDMLSGIASYSEALSEWWPHRETWRRHLSGMHAAYRLRQVARRRRARK